MHAVRDLIRRLFQPSSRPDYGRDMSLPCKYPLTTTPRPRDRRILVGAGFKPARRGSRVVPMGTGSNACALFVTGFVD
jgi:hypothetical protein